MQKNQRMTTMKMVNEDCFNVVIVDFVSDEILIVCLSVDGDEEKSASGASVWQKKVPTPAVTGLRIITLF